jgi:hypothetical protein
MKKLFLTSIVLLFFCSNTIAQFYSIKGRLIDSTQAPLSFASVFLLNVRDSTLVTFTRAEENGNFVFKNIKKQDYLVKTTYVGLLPYQRLIKYESSKNELDLGTIALKPISKDLMEVVIRTAKAPLEIKGDTIEYDASKFKVPPGSTVEDLLKRLPGVSVDAEGNIKAQGRKVDKVLVDGKNFFGDDPKVATKNLPAEAITKVQVFDDKSEQAKLTGVEDGKKEKTVNLQLKEEFKKGGFGKGTVAAGTDERLSAKMNYNRFDAKNQFSVLGFGNNINQSGLNRDDYQDFKGSQSYNWNDNADFGFGQGNQFIFFSEDNMEAEPGMNIPQSWRPGLGFSENLAGGINYNYDTKKTKWSSSYFYNQTDQSLNQINQSQIVLPGISYLSKSDIANANFSENHRANFRLEKMLDSTNTLVWNFNGRLSNIARGSFQDFDYNNNTNEKFRSQQNENSTDNKSSAISSSLIFRHKFKKKGRNLAWSASYNGRNSDQNAFQESIINEFRVSGQSFPLGGLNLNINQNNLTVSNSQEYKSSVLYTEPVTKTISSETFFNYAQKYNDVDRDVFNLFDSRKRVDNLSNFFDNTQGLLRLGQGFRFNINQTNLSIGLAASKFDLDGDIFTEKNAKSLSKVNKTYWAVLPNLELNLQSGSGAYSYFSYNPNFELPKINDLQPFINNQNPLNIVIGNADLKPAQNHSIRLNHGKFDPVSFKSFWLGANFNYKVNSVVYSYEVDKSLISTTRPQNISGAQNLNLYSNFEFPIIKTKVSTSFNFNISNSVNPMFINGTENIQKTFNYYLGWSLDLTPASWFSLFSRINYNPSSSKFSVNTAQNQRFYNNTVNLSSVIQMPQLWFYTMDFNYTNYVNKTQNFDQKLPIMNISVYKILGKAKKSEIRLSAYDLFNKNLGVSQFATGTAVINNRTETLARYIMLSYTYNMRGIKSNVKKNRWE